MDPRTHPLADLSKTEEPLNHARTLKSDMTNAASGEAAVGKAPSSFSWTTLRQSPRLRCSGSVEFRTEDGDAHLWGTLTDISLQGCYVEMNRTFPVNTRVYLVLKSLGIRIQTQATVRTSFMSLGMGLSFVDIEPGQQQLLQQLVDVLTGSATPRFGVARESHGHDPMPIDPIAFLAEITEFFRKKPLLSREEFNQIAERVRHP